MKATNSKILNLVIDRVTPFYNSLDQWHGIEHGKRVADFAKRINQIEQGDPLLVEAGAWLHQYHDNLDDLTNLLRGLPVSDDQKSELYEIVNQCRPHKISEASSIEAKIVFDADSLDLMGPSGIVRELLCNVVARGQAQKEGIKAAQKVQKIFAEKLQTEGGRKIAKQSIFIANQFWEEYKRWEALCRG